MTDKEAKYEKGLKELNKAFKYKGIKFESVDNYIARIKRRLSK